MTGVKQSIHTIAQELFALHGYSGVSISDIALKANIAKSTALHHFPGKPKLYQEVLKKSLSRFSELSSRPATGKNLQQQIGENLKNLFRWMVSEPIHAKLLNRIFMDNPKAAHIAARKYWLPVIRNMLGVLPAASKHQEERLRLFILFVVNSVFQMAFSIELQTLLVDGTLSRDELLSRYENLIDDLVKGYVV